MSDKKNILLSGVAVLLLAASACTQDELADDTRLPEGEYPLQIGSVSLTAEVSEQPWTRVSENQADGMSSVWKDGDKIGVHIGDNEETGIYVVNVDETTGNITVTPEKAVYWKDKQPANLTFSHQLAKVRVKLKGDKAGEVQQVYVRSYPTSTHSHGTLDNQDKSVTPQYVPMRRATYGGETYWEANLLKGYLDADNTFRVSKDGNSFVQVTLDADVPITVGQIHTITINVEQAPTEIDLSTYEGTTLTVSGKTTIKGNGQQKNLQVTVEPDTELTLQDVSISYEEGPTIICQGNAHITLSGNNKLSPASKGINYTDLNTLGSGIEVRSSGTLTIESEPNAALDITRRRNEDPGITPMYGAGIGLYDNANLVIKGGTITVTGGSPNVESGANIGGFVSQNAGTITLEGGTFTLQNKCMGSTLVGAGSYGTCGMVTIRAGVTINGTTYTEDHIGAIQ